MKVLHRLLSMTITAALGLVPATGMAQATYPVKPIRLIVPLAPGGASDNAARALGQALTKTLGQSIVVENRPGGNGAVAAQALLGAAPDGYTLLWAPASMAALPLLQKNAPFASIEEFVPVSIVGRLTFCMVVHAGTPGATLAEFVGHARANPGKLSFASSTMGEYMAMAQLMGATGVSMIRVPYKGGAQAVPDLLEGRVQASITPISPVLPFVRDARLRVLAVTLPQRSTAAPDIPTMAEAGVPGVSVPTWQAIYAPPKTPRDIADRLAREIRQVLQDPAVKSELERQFFAVDGSTPEALSATIKDDLRAWAQFVRDNAIAPE